MGKRNVRQHQPLRIPKTWKDEEKMFAVQTDKLFDEVYALLGRSEVIKDIAYVAVLRGLDYQLPSGTNAAIGEYIIRGGLLGVVTSAITGGVTNIIEGTNWTKVPEGGLNSLEKKKTDKVLGATNNNFAALDANGNLKDSGHKHSDYLPVGGITWGAIAGQ